jgi:hypothetical protein
MEIPSIMVWPDQKIAAGGWHAAGPGLDDE